MKKSVGAKSFFYADVPSSKPFHWQQQLMEVGIKKTTAHTSHITHARDNQTCDGSVRILAVRAQGGWRGDGAIRCPCVSLYTVLYSVYYPP